MQITEGSVRDFNALVYGNNTHPNTLNYLSNQFNNVSQTLTAAGQQFFANASDMYEKFLGSEAVRLARAAMNRVDHMFQYDNIRHLSTLAHIQNAPLTMQRWIMAEPTVRELYQQQRCDGYSGSYLDMEPGRIGNDHYDYRRVMDMMVVDTPGEEEYHYTSFFDDIKPGDAILTLDQKVDILATWDEVASIVRRGEEDPTSVWCGQL